MRAVGAFGETESVSPNHYTILQDHTMPNAAEFPDDRMRMG